MVFVGISTNSFAFPPQKENKFAIISPSSSSGNITGSSLDVDIIVNPSFPNFISLPKIGDTLGKRTGYAFIGSNPSFQARLNNKKNNISIKSVDIVDSKNKTFLEIPFKAFSVPNTEDEIVLSINIPNTVSSGLAKFVLNTNSGSALSGEIELLNYFNVSTKENTKLFGEPAISRTSLKKLSDNFSLTLQGKNFTPNTIIYSSLTSPSEKIESTSRSNTSIAIFPATLNIEIEDITISKGNDSIKIRFKLQDLKEDTDAVISVTTPRGISSKSINLMAGFFGI